MIPFKIFFTSHLIGNVQFFRNIPGAFTVSAVGLPLRFPAILLIIYLFGINLAGLLLMGADKQRARKRRWRIPEKTLFLIAAFGGSIGSILGMLLFRHKTRHLSFCLGMPAILALQIMVGWAVCH